ncbi:MAG: hypothetical protein N2484_14930 [Clostridia bacterium]|nr:hypothetical protein [Clostridia bacterium]
MNYKAPGVLSLILAFAAIGIAVYQLFAVSIIMGLAYTICTPIAFLNVLYHYCRKCPHVTDETCRHVIFGWIVSKLFKPSTPSKYSTGEILLALSPLAVFFAFPQYWLLRQINLFIAFWVLMLLAIIVVRTGVCKECKNINCKFCQNANNCRP